MIDSEILTTFEGKKIVLIMPCHFDIYKVINYNLSQMGLHTIPIVPKDFKYRCLKDRVVNFLRKTLLNDRGYKEYLVEKSYSAFIYEKIRNFKENEIDYTLIIRPDLLYYFNEKQIAHLLKIGKKTVAYQWDGLKRYPKAFKFIKYFKKFYIFDKEDYIEYKETYPNLQLCSNFYFDYDGDKPNNEIKKKNNIRVFYLGSHIEKRIKDILFVIKELEKYGNVEFDIQLFAGKKKNLPFQNEKIKFIPEFLDFFDNLDKVKQADIILDLKTEEHNGLSLRFFEALKYQKKIITTNKSVFEYDFYNPNNIFILYKDDIKNIEKFIKTPYEKIDDNIVKKYAFSQWIYRCFAP